MTTLTIEIPTWGLWLIIIGVWAFVILEAISIRLKWKMWKLHK